MIALISILGIGSLLIPDNTPEVSAQGRATAEMCTTRLLSDYSFSEEDLGEEFVIEQDLVFTWDSVNLDI